MKSSSSGVTLRLKVSPRASRERIEGPVDGVLKVSVTAAPERGRANAAVIELLARALHMPKSKLEVVSGAASRHKTLRIAGNPSEIGARLKALNDG